MVHPSGALHVQMVVNVDGDWICLTVNTSFHHNDKYAAAKEISRIFGEDLLEARIVCDDAMEKSGEYFVFVCCRSYSEHLDELKKSPAVGRVVPSYEEPSVLTHREVDEFSESVEAERSKRLAYGDIVLVKENEKEAEHLKRLSGLVVKMPGECIGTRKVSQGKYGVFFRFHTTSFCVSISATSLEVLGNVFEQVVVPPFRQTVKRDNLFDKYLDRARKAASEIVSGDKICRKRRRAHEATYHA